MTTAKEMMQEKKNEMRAIYEKVNSEYDEKVRELDKLEETYLIAKSALKGEIADIKKTLSDARKELGIKTERLPVVQTIKKIMDGEDVYKGTLVDKVCAELNTKPAKVKMAINGLVKRGKLVANKDDDGDEFYSVPSAD